MTEPAREIIRLPGKVGPYFFSLLLFTLVLGLAYHAILVFSAILSPYRFPIPYAVPIFDTPFALVALGVGYLCMERHRLLQDFRSASLGVSLGLTALLALAHIATQPDYPGTPGVNPGIAPYFFFLSYLLGFVGIGLATHLGERRLVLTELGRLWVGLGMVCVSVLVVILVLQIRPLLPPLVMKPGRLTPFAIQVVGVSSGLLGVWALWGVRRKLFGKEQDWFAGFLLFAGFIWLFGLVGFLLFPFRYGVSWYIAGLARPIGVGVVFVGLLREQVWLYREARARQVDLEHLHTAGQALVTTLDPQRIVDTIAAKALEITGADATALFRFDAQAQVLRAVSRAGRVGQEYISGLELPKGMGLGGVAIAEGRPVWSSNLQTDARIPLPPAARDRVRREGLRAALAVPLLLEGGRVFGSLSVYYRNEREFTGADVELLAAYGTQVGVAVENARAFEQLALRSRNDAALREFSQRLLETIDEEDILNGVVRITRELLQADYAGVLLFDPATGLLRMEAGIGWEPGTVGTVTVSPTTESFSGYVFLRKENVESEDLSQERRFSVPAYFPAHGIRAGMAVPLGVRDQPAGVLGASYRTPRRFSDEERRVLQSLAHQTALALEKVRLYAELQTNLRRLQETQAQLIQADKLKALGTLLSGMAHELNSPLTSILLSVQLLKQQHVLPEVIQKRLDVVEEEAERASRIVKDLLVFARRKAPERRQVDLNEVVKAALALQGPEFSLNHIEVVSELDPALLVIWADSHQLQQVLLNLFINATAAMKSAHGRGRLSVRTSLSGREARVTVEDDGPGIPPEHLGRVFDPFFTTKGVGEGTGLGLSLSLGIVEAHGGRITAENAPGAGARFTIELPIGEGIEPAEAPSAERPRAVRRARVLVVEDEASVRRLLTEVFEVLGHRVETAATGQEAMARMEREAYDLVTLDLRLPDVSGKDVWRWLLDRKPAQAARVVFMTGDTMSSETQEFLRDAGRPALTKPLSIERIREVVGSVLGAGPSGASP